MSSRWNGIVVRFAYVGGMLMLAALFVWRGSTFVDADPGTVLPAMMCTMLSMFLVLTAITYAFGREPDERGGVA